MLKHELSWSERGQLWLRLGLRLVLLLLLAILGFRFGPPLISLISPFVVALIAAWVLTPLVRWLYQNLHLPRKFAALVLILAVFAVLFALIWGLTSGIIREVISLAENWDSLVASFERAVSAVGESFFKIMSLFPDSVHTTIDNMMEQFFHWLDSVIPMLLGAVVSGLSGVAQSLPSFLVAMVVFVMATYFITADYPRLRSTLTQHLPRGPRIFLVQIKKAVSAGFGGYIKAQFILSCGVFFILLAGFLLIRQSYALLLALILAIVDFIPILGAGTGLIPWAVIEVFMGNFRHALGLLIVWGLVSLFRRLAEPKVLGDQTGLSPILSLVSVYVGMKLAGVAGMILGPVLCLVVRNVMYSGVLDRSTRDLKLACADMAAILRGGDEPESDDTL